MGISKERVTMKQYQLLPLFLFLSLYPSSIFSRSYRCLPNCRPGIHTKDSKCYVCKPLVTTDCSTKEIVNHRCGCPRCAKAKGEKCGGMTGLRGKCASFLTCKDIPSRSRVFRRWSLFRHGVCVEKQSKKRNKSALAKLLEFFRQLF